MNNKREQKCFEANWKATNGSKSNKTYEHEEHEPQLAPERPYAILIEAMWMLISSRVLIIFWLYLSSEIFIEIGCVWINYGISWGESWSEKRVRPGEQAPAIASYTAHNTTN